MSTDQTQTRKTVVRNGKRFKSAYVASIGDMDSDAQATPAAAKADLLEKVAAGLDGLDYDPILLPIPDGHIVVSRSPFYGWTYHFDRAGRKSGWCLSQKNDKASVLAGAKRHADTLNADAASVVGTVS